MQVQHPDNPEPYVYTEAPIEVEAAIQRRLERRPVVLHPDRPNVYIYDPGNFWDGPTHVTWEPDSGHFTFSGWHGEEHFPMVGPLR